MALAKRELTAKRELFAQHVASGLSQAEAYRRAGYSVGNMLDTTVWVESSKLANHPDVSQRITELTTKASIRNAISFDWVVNGLRENFERAMQAKPVLDRMGNPTGEYVYDGGTANKSLELIARLFGYFPKEGVNLTQVNVDNRSQILGMFGSKEALLAAAREVGNDADG